jgi:hypothetical protein
MPAQLIERALAEWREGERLLRDLPRLDPDHETVRLTVIRLRETYRTLTSASADSMDLLEKCRAQIEAAHDVIVAVEAKLGPNPAP